MAGTLSEYTQGAVAGFIGGVNMPAPPANLFLALSTVDPLDTGSGLAEPGGAYARQALTLSAPNTTLAEGTSSANDADIQFTGLGASTVTHIAVMDSAAGGNMLFTAALDVVRAVTAGDTVSFATGVVKLTVGDNISQYLGEALINWMRGTIPPNAPSGLQLALSRGGVGRDGTGIDRPMITDGYADQTITLNAATFVSGTGTTLTSSNDIVYGPSHTNSWGTITDAFIVSSDDSSQILQGVSSHPELVALGDGVGVTAGSVSFVVK
ncbi:MAG: hypothetical protein DSY80_04160 [Desulfocapsa sp.]|nr:MAG: hypothetical protein DSY80_04160 [Desulfocapsa sp.]